MGNTSRHTGGGLSLPKLLLVIDLLLLVVIGVSWFSGRGQDSTDTAAYAQTEPAQAEPAAPQKPEQTEKESAAPEEEASPAPPASASYDTAERPTTGDFMEWYAQDVMWNGPPSGAEALTELSQVSGTWKGLIYYDPENTHASEAIELLNFTVGGTESALTLTADWYSIYWVQDGQGSSEEDMEDLVFNGRWENGSLYVTGAASIRLTDFYTQNGKQYAAGTMDCSDGTPAKVAMVRP